MDESWAGLSLPQGPQGPRKGPEAGGCVNGFASVDAGPRPAYGKLDSQLTTVGAAEPCVRRRVVHGPSVESCNLKDLHRSSLGSVAARFDRAELPYHPRLTHEWMSLGQRAYPLIRAVRPLWRGTPVAASTTRQVKQ
jgi:hypothetical protein